MRKPEAQISMSRGAAHRGVVGVALHVLAVDQRLDALLEVGGAHRELQLAHELVDQQRVAQRLARLHGAHNRRVDLRQTNVSQRVKRSFVWTRLHSVEV